MSSRERLAKRLRVFVMGSGVAEVGQVESGMPDFSGIVGDLRYVN